MDSSSQDAWKLAVESLDDHGSDPTKIHSQCLGVIVETLYKNGEDMKFLRDFRDFMTLRASHLDTRPEMYTVNAFLYGSFLQGRLYTSSDPLNDPITVTCIPNPFWAKQKSDDRIVIIDTNSQESYGNNTTGKCFVYSEQKTIPDSVVKALEKDGCTSVVRQEGKGVDVQKFKNTPSFIASVAVPTGPGSGTDPRHVPDPSENVKKFLQNLTEQFREDQLKTRKTFDDGATLVAIGIAAVLYWNLSKNVL
jgi:hypothetical protein